MAILDRIVVEIAMPDISPDDMAVMRDAIDALRGVDPFTADRLEYVADKLARMELTARVARGEDAT